MNVEAIFRYVDADEDGALFVHNPTLQMRARARAAVRVWDCGGGDHSKLCLGLSETPGGRGLAPTLSLAGLVSAGNSTFAQVTKPANGVIMPEGYVRAMAQFAYLWGWPLVNMVNRRALFSEAPELGLLGGIVPVAPRGRIAMLVDYVSPAETFVTCPNQDVVYELGFFGLDAEPVVIQVPDFGDRFWVYAFYDNRSDQFGHLGKPYDTQQGFYLLARPNRRGRSQPVSPRSSPQPDRAR